MTTTASGGSLGVQRDMNVTPMLDVMLVLLVIFMAGVARVHRTVDAQLPQPCPAICESTTAIVLEIRPGPRYAINGAPVDAGALGGRLREIYASRPEKLLQVAGDSGVSYQQVVTAMDVAHAAGVKVIGLAGREVARGK